MAYFLRIYNRKRGRYLQIVDSFHNKEKNRTDHKSFKSLGYESDLIASGITDPVSYYKSYVENLNKERNDSKALKVSSTPVIKNLGFFLLKALIDKLNISGTIKILALKRDFQFDLETLIRQLIYSRVICPCSKSKTADVVFPYLYNSTKISSDQVYDGVEFLGHNYKKYIELFNVSYSNLYGRKTDTVYFDCTNYYFEIDLAKDDKQKGPSKENKKSPIIGQALLLDANQVPIGMEMFPGNESEKPYIRKLVDDMKSRYKASGKTIQVADKGLNCASNIVTALKNKDGYVFSKSVHGKNLSSTEKKWVLNEKDYIVINDIDGNPSYKIKECIDTFSYKLDGQTYLVKEKRVVSYNYDLAKKQIAEINKQVSKASELSTAKAAHKEEYGDSVKYVNFDGDISLNLDKIKEDISLAGYNLIVTSELDKSAQEIYDIYHGLWRIEESFRITKSYLDARPVYLRSKYSIYGHFLICYLSLFLLRVLELNIFKNELNVNDLVNFMRNYTISLGSNNTYTNNSIDSKAMQIIKQKLNINYLDNLFLSKKDIEMVYQIKF